MSGVDMYELNKLITIVAQERPYINIAVELTTAWIRDSYYM